MSNYLLITLFSFLFAASTSEIDENPPHPAFPYQLNQPNAIFEMPEALKEISGLGITEDRKNLIAVNDEEGIVYLINKMDGQKVKEIEFWDEGDYEGLEVVGQDAYVIKSSGTIFSGQRLFVGQPQHGKDQDFFEQGKQLGGIGLR